MKKLFISILIFAVSANLFAQWVEHEETTFRELNCITVGILNGGGSLIGVDLEFLIYNKLSAQIGAGLIGFGAGINWHFKPTLQSSFVSLQYYNQGIGDNFVQKAIGPAFVFRAKRLFTFQFGWASILERGPAYPTNIAKQDFMLTYAVGIYKPF